jgi:hypothetical protein
LRPAGFAGGIVHSGASGAQNVVAVLFLVGWDQYGFHKKRAGIRYDKLVFFHSVGHVVHSAASSVQNADVLFFIPGCNRYGFQKKRVKTRYAELVFLHLVGSMGPVVRSGASGV